MKKKDSFDSGIFPWSPVHLDNKDFTTLVISSLKGSTDLTPSQIQDVVRLMRALFNVCLFVRGA